MTRWQQELEKVRAKHHGRLHPKDVVATARDKANPLHDHFEWDDTKAGQAYRLQQAVMLIQQVTFLPADSDEPVRAYVSLSSDRLARRGYRAMADVLSDRQLRAQLLADALAELKAFSSRYDRIRKVAKVEPVFTAIQKATRGRRSAAVHAEA